MCDDIAHESARAHGRVGRSASCGKGRLSAALASIALCMPTGANAHAWNIPYYLPVPLWLYAYAATGTLIVSFMILAFASGARAPEPGRQPETRAKALRIPASLMNAGQIASAVFVALLVVAGIAGTANPFLNPAMSGFWIWFYLGALYVSAILGDVYAFTNPLALLLRAASRCLPVLERGRYRYPPRVASWPALGGYIALIALELFGAGRPRDVGLFLVVYVLYALIGAFCFGRERWLAHGDTFGVLCRLCARLSPLKWRRAARGHVIVEWRNPIADMSRDGLADTSIVAMLSFMLSSTAYDGLRDTATWNGFFWRSIYPHVVDLFPSLGGHYAFSAEILLTWQWLAFATIGIAYYLVFLGCCTAGATCTRSSSGGAFFSRQFCLILLPIAFFYNVCHYFTLFWDQGRQIVRLVSDPLGLGWNLLPMVAAADEVSATQALIDVGYIWHAQVLLILAGHVVSVMLTHAIAARSGSRAGRSTVGQLPLLVLTIALTITGLWILSLPLA
ncbi:hypothetical protein [Burkholderia multivorans]|uniref:hypothetical protein n=1 Tax=Burkholderia multivorans TaxID=87883 RepID=UPI0021BF9AAC|nr:hypothetical protein [Burkholderia multivorans]MDR8761266.1 hypothetical protein [Burkholderia multivorans]MDR8767871.1 hypothetical protein [Burkholderia multivorans]MDR8772165.1 hypothetical protein [Burkholderia multivorans]MDR8792113.1 hypothetical protein [Burkholderia multivorans]MDR8797855.1 hypothetical protein [Burkholderia multivorans]